MLSAVRNLSSVFSARARRLVRSTYLQTIVTKRNSSKMAARGYSWDKWEGQEKRVSPSAERNKQVILEELRKHLPKQGLVLEVASGTGQHITHFAAALSPHLQWQPSDVTDDLFGSIAAYTAEAQLRNVGQPVLLDASVPVDQWPVQNRRVTLGLVAGAGKLLQPGGVLFIYGPFKIDGKFTTDSNRDFHENLVAQNPEWGYRDVADITAAANAAGLEQKCCVPMPANNFVLVYTKA